MASVGNTITLQVLRSVNTPDYTDPWTVLDEATADAVEAIPLKYRKWTGSAFEEMTQGEKDAVDAAELAALRAAALAELDDLEDRIRTSYLVFIDEFNRRQDQFDALLVAMNNQIQNATNLANLQSRWATFTTAAQGQALPQRTFADFKTAFQNKQGQ